MLEQALNTTSSSFNKVILPLLKKQSAGSYIKFAILLVAAQRIISFFRVPNKIRQFPAVSVLSVIRSLYYNESIADRTRRLVVPIMKKGHKFYTSRFQLVWTVFITDPVIAKQLLYKNDKFPKSPNLFDAFGDTSPVIQFMGTDNIVFSSGDVWKKQRQIVNPAFHRPVPIKTMNDVVPDLFAYIEREKSDDGEVLVSKAMKNFALDILGLSIFRFDFQSLKGDPESWTKSYNLIVEGLFDPWANFFAHLDFIMNKISPSRRNFVKATKDFTNMLESLIDKRKQEIMAAGGVDRDIPESEKDLLTIMIEADIKEKFNSSTAQLRHNVAVFFLAGHDTTANTLSLCLYYLAKNKHVQRKTRAEIIKILGDDDCDIAPTNEELKQLEYLNMVIKENLRMNFPFESTIPRTAQEDTEIGGEVFYKGTDISIDIAAIHYDPRLWSNPDQFIPERFGEGGEQESHTGLTWMPFGSGTRQCLGMQFSLTEQRIVLAALLKKYEIDISKDSIHYDHVVFEQSQNVAPKSLNLKFTKRY